MGSEPGLNLGHLLTADHEAFRSQIRDLSNDDVIILSSLLLIERYRRYGVCRDCAFERGFFIAEHFDAVREESGCSHDVEPA